MMRFVPSLRLACNEEMEPGCQPWPPGSLFSKKQQPPYETAVPFLTDIRFRFFRRHDFADVTALV